MDVCVAACGKLTEIFITSITISILLVAVFLFLKIRGKIIKIVFIFIALLVLYYSLDISVADSCLPCGIDSTQFGGFRLLPDWIKLN